MRLGAGERWSRGEALLAAAITAAALWFAFAHSGTSLWLDEAFSVWLAKLGPAEAVRALRQDSGPPLHYLLLWAWMKLAGDGERAVRALSGLAYLGTAGVMYAAGRRPTGSRLEGVVAAALTVASTLAIRHASSARMYALLGLWSAASTLLFARVLLDAARQGPRSARLWAWTFAINAVGPFVQYWAGFLLLAQAAAYLLLFRKAAPGRWVLGQVAALVPFAVLWGPSLWAQLGAGAGAWFEPVGFSALPATFVDFYGRYLAPALFLLAALALVLRSFRVRVQVRMSEAAAAAFGGRVGAALLLTSVLALGVPLLVSQLRPIYLIGRYTIVALPPFTLWLAWVLCRSLPRRWVAAAVAVLLGLELLSAQAAERRFAAKDRTESTRASVARLLPQVPAGASFVFTGLGRLTVQYYLGRAGRSFPTHVFPPELEAHPGWMRWDLLPAQAPRLREDAANLAASLRATRELWHVHDRDDGVAQLLEEALGAAFHRVRTEPMPGSFHDTVSIYRPR